MSNGFLSQEEIDSLLNGGGSSDAGSVAEEPVNNSTEEAANSDDNSLLSDVEKDLLGEVGNISMGSASTALAQCTNQPVNITTPIVSITTLGELRKDFEGPNIVLEVGYTSGIVGQNILVMKSTDAIVVANLMMGGNGEVNTEQQLSDIEISAVQEAMNQMIGSAATSMATMFAREVNISPPISKTWKENTIPLSDNIPDEEKVVKISFTLTIGTLIDSNIMQILPLETAKKVIAIMMGEDTGDNNEPVQDSTVQAAAPAQPKTIEQQPAAYQEPPRVEERPQMQQAPQMQVQQPVQQMQPQMAPQPPVEVNKVNFEPLANDGVKPVHNNIDLILDVPLEISVVLGRTKKSIKEILDLGNGSLVELDKLADEPVEILVNGKKIANGEVVVVDENFGVRITNVISGEERIKSLR